jgi:hypothetical protein
MKCSDIDAVYSLFIAALVAYIILTVTSFTASIFGCRGTCCAPAVSIWEGGGGRGEKLGGLRLYQMKKGRGYFAGLRVTKRNKATVLLILTLFQTTNLTPTLILT